MIGPWCNKAAGGAESAGRRIVHFRTRQRTTDGGAACDQDLAVIQQRRRMKVPQRRHTAGGSESAGGRIVNLRTRQGIA